MRTDRDSNPSGTSCPELLFDAQPPAYLRRAGGRETFAWRIGPTRDVIVKRMSGRGGRREHDNLEALAEDGLPVPRAIAWSQERGRLSLVGPQRSLVVMERIAADTTLRDQLAVASPAERARCSSELLEIVARLHERGWVHRDLYLQHFLIERSGADARLVLIDVGRARRPLAVRRRWFVKDLAALVHSCPECVGTGERLRFLARYLDRRGIRGRSERSAWARAVRTKAARIAAHVPRDERTLGVIAGQAARIPAPWPRA